MERLCPGTSPGRHPDGMGLFEENELRRSGSRGVGLTSDMSVKIWGTG
jgi:hypothetical protein